MYLLFSGHIVCVYNKSTSCLVRGIGILSQPYSVYVLKLCLLFKPV